MWYNKNMKIVRKDCFMIRIYTSMDKLNGTKIIKDPESYFKSYVSSKNFDTNDEQVMGEIDNAKLKNKDTGAIETPFGEASINNLSTGCKTVLCYLYVKRNNTKYGGINVTECGANALESLFSQMDRLDDSTTKILLMHTDELYTCKEREYLINDTTIIHDLSDIMGVE